MFPSPNRLIEIVPTLAAIQTESFRRARPAHFPNVFLPKPLKTVVSDQLPVISHCSLFAASPT
jgi:hypothetical protein